MHVRGDTAKALFDFANIKTDLFGKQSTPSHFYLLPSSSRHNNFKFLGPSNHSTSPVPPGRVKIKVSRSRKTANKSHHPLTVNFEDLRLSNKTLEVDKIDSCGWGLCLLFDRVSNQRDIFYVSLIKLTLGPNRISEHRS